MAAAAGEDSDDDDEESTPEGAAAPSSALLGVEEKFAAVTDLLAELGSDWSEVSAEQAVQVMVSARQAVCLLEAVTLMAAARLVQVRTGENQALIEEALQNGGGGSEIGKWDGSAEVSAALGISAGSAHRLVNTSAGLSRLPVTAAMLASGRIDLRAATLISQETADLQDPEKLAACEEVIFEALRRHPRLKQTSRALGARARRAVLTVDHEAVRRRRQRAADDRSVWVQALSDGMARLIAEGPAEAIQAMYQAITGMADTLTWRPGNGPGEEGIGSGPGATETEAAGDASPHATEPTPAEPTGAEPTDAEPTDAEPTDAEPTDAEPTDAEPTDAEPTDAEPTDAEPTDVPATPDTTSSGAEPAQPVNSPPDHPPGSDWLADLVASRLPAWFMAVNNPRCRFSAGRARFDTLRWMAEAILADPTGALMTHQGRAATVQVTISLETLLGLREDPGNLIGYGPLPADVARLMATDSTLQRLIYDPASGITLDTGTSRYRATAGMRRLLFAVHPTCTFPGCEVPAERCDVDHIVSWPVGPTKVCSQHPACRRHHNLKTHQPGWEVSRDIDTNAIRWTTPTGITGLSLPQDHRLRPESGASARATDRESTFAAWQRSRQKSQSTRQKATAEHRPGCRVRSGVSRPHPDDHLPTRSPATTARCGTPGQVEGQLLDGLMASWPDPFDWIPNSAERPVGEEFDPRYRDEVALLTETRERGERKISDDTPPPF